MRKTLFTHLFILGVVLGFAFTGLAQNKSNSSESLFSTSSKVNNSESPSQVGDVTILQWDDGVNFNSVGLTNGGTFEVSARFDASITGPLAGHGLTKIEVYVASFTGTLVLKVYGQDTPTNPGTVLYSEDVTSSVIYDAWNTFTLTTYVPITGEDIWVGYEVTHLGSEFPAGIDAGPHVTDGDWINLGGWASLYDLTGGAIDGNWNIHAYIEDVGGGTITIAEAIEDLNGDLIPDRLGDVVTVQGVIFSPNYQSSNSSYYIHDGTAGVNWFLGGTLLDFNLGDEVMITGEVAQYNGLTEIGIASDTDITLVSTGNPLPDFILLTVDDYLANPNSYEGSLVGFISLSLVGGTWPSPGSSATLQMSDGTSTLDMRIDSDTDIDDNSEPSWPMDVLAIGSQYCSGGCVDAGFQILPRFYSDFLPPNTIPVELTSFTAQANDGVVYLNWTTATEQNNQGFEVQRSTNNQFITIGFANGYGTTTKIHNYLFTDTDVQTGTYYYRLKQVDYNGEYEYSDVIQVDVAPVTFSLEQNYPNPFNPSTIITFSLAIDSKVNLSVFDVLGQEVANLVTSNMTAGVHEINFDAANLNSGVYLYRINATGVDGTNFTSVKKMILTK